MTSSLPGIDTAVGKLGELGRGFLLGYFFPVVLFTLVNYGLFVAAFGDEKATSFVTNYKLATATGLVVLLLLQFTLAWVLAPLATALRRAIEGELLPVWLRRPLVRHSRRRMEALTAEFRAAAEHMSIFERLVKQAEALLVDARKAGAATNTVAQPDLIRTARMLVGRTSLITGGASSAGERRARLENAGAAVCAVEAALKVNSANLETDQASNELDEVQIALQSKLRTAAAEARIEAEDAAGALHSAFVADDVRASALGNYRAVMECYTRSVYGVDFGYMWPRIESVLGDGASIAPTLTDSKAQLEFAVVMLAGTGLTAAVWLVVLLASGGSLMLFLAIGGAAPLLLSIFYTMALEGQQSVTKSVRSAIDALRLDLLAKLGSERPTTTRGERDLWLRLQGLSHGENVDLKIAPAA